jgi:uncharacterized protein
MQDTIEKLLILQDCDRKLMRVKSELSRVGPDRTALQAKADGTAANLESAKLRVKQLETERKKLELEVESRKQQIAKYANQQLETRKNEEYKALQHEIDHCKEEISKIEDRELELMEQSEAAAKQVIAANQDAASAKKMVEKEISDLNAREENLKKELAELDARRVELSTTIDDNFRSRYDRLLKNKGDNVIVGVQHGVCGGCHMKLPTQVIVQARTGQELTTCTNCGRILYYTRDMDLAVVD